ncbi:MAG: hypothetical protein HYX28_05910 [Candidatus Koribacter versatilis]|uniref:Uncharacterized protein n=1 Tax=Candidatus Korobacter versatilis TaxID=658062 RepID=A0A932EPI7_9BACT|nr:hypothetical protein [Candidatus Koribacter versatilis]
MLGGGRAAEHCSGDAAEPRTGDRVGIEDHAGIFPTRNRFLNDGRQLFVKISYQFRY